MANETVADDMRSMFGPVRRWKDQHDILYAENDFLSMAYVVFDPSKDRTTGFPGLVFRNDICVETITAEQAKLWDGCECRQS